MQILFIRFPFTIRALSRAFGHTPLLLNNQKDAGPLYSIAGALLSVADIRAVKPENRTVSHWRVLVDWDLQSTRQYVVVDPFDPRGLLYLTRGEYLLQSRVSLANDLTLIVIARPGDVAPVPSSSKISPTSKTEGGEGLSSTRYFQNKANRLTWKDFVRLRRFASFNVKIVEGMVSVHSKSIERAALVWGRQLLHYSGVTAPERRLSGFRFLTRHLRTILTCNGPNYLVKRLKIELFAVYSYLSGNPLSSTQDLGFRVRLRHGLPVFIPADMRREIRKGNLVWIRIWVSLLNIYRAIKVKTPDPETAYKTIRKPLPAYFSGSDFIQFEYFCRYVFPRLVKDEARRIGKPIPNFSYTSALGYIVRSAAANLRGTSSIFSIILDAKAWFQAKNNYVLDWFTMHGDHPAAAIMTAVARESHFPDDFNKVDDMQDWVAPPFKDNSEKIAWEGREREFISDLRSEGCFSGFVRSAWKLIREGGTGPYTVLGRLFNFDAPGGKLRTVAICDYWTQIALKPVHDHLFAILKGLAANDATFDQQGAVDRYFERGLKPHWSFDLSAATDSIPIVLYRHVLAPFLTSENEEYTKAYERATLWSNIMTDRDFSLPSPRKGEIGHTGYVQRRKIRYATGQPMGALSSWASMALVHHALVQFAHWQQSQSDAANAQWFDTYMILGDDVDISVDTQTALNYQKACATFLIKIGLAKSLKSDSNFFEFANQRFHPDGNISPLSFMEDVVSNTWASRVEFASRIASRFGVRMGPSSLIRLVTTARQWQHLAPEMSGLRDRIFMSFLKFILLGPFVPVWHSTAPISIESIFKWMQQLESVLRDPNLLSNEDRQNIDKILTNKIADRCQRLLDRITNKLAQRSQLPIRAQAPVMAFKGAPFSTILLPSVHLLGIIQESFAHYALDVGEGEELYSDNFVTALRKLGLDPNQEKLIRDTFKMFDTNTIRSPRLAPVSYLYLFYCAFLHNKDLQRQVSELTTRLFKLRKQIKDRDVPMQLFARLVGEKPSPLADLVRLYLDVSALPQAIRLDLEGVNPSSIGIKAAKVVPQDVAFELLGDVIPAIAQYTGISIRALPIMSSRSMMNHRSINAMLKFFKNMKAEAKKIKYSVFR